MPDKLMPWHKTYLTNIEYNRVDLVKEGANSKAYIKLFKSRGGQDMKLEEILKLLKPEHREVIEKAIKEEQGKAAKAEEARKAAEAELAKAKQNEKVEGSEEDILKSIKDPAVRQLLETQIAKTKAAEEELRKAREAQAQQEAIAKAREVPHIGVEESKLADLYKKLKFMDEKVADEVFGIFKSASAMIAEGGILTEIGKTAANAEEGVATSEAEAWNKIEQKADEIMKSAKVSKAAAITKAIEENPELYEEYLKAQRGQFY